jgi:hypothetical protein
MIGCASKGSVSALEQRVTALEDADKTVNAQVESVVTEHAALQGNVAEINAKLDGLFRKNK